MSPLLEAARFFLGELLQTPQRPGPLYVLVEPAMIGFDIKVLFPAPLAADHVTSREFTSQTNDAPPVVNTFPGDAADASAGSAVIGDVVSMSLVDIDQAGNRSPASTRSITVADTVPPHQPDALNVELTQVELPDPV